ncbi:RagB/SusD family nutrient uptake outer membrane protein [Polaribacter vadi]|uniref:RagB/SusD family nutrient uptake outer membrane protein n=1 Tax=Polaribacter TaxID=52959 RepID=UPI001C09DE49|nr:MULTISPECIES: RagB/SusD family nutrient uptake outer membrane protein [Polaribacter]MBU3011291.1 RagB/SusD family nutrient uptake outer membrane protein [Polaribacter vadi]MDO6741104.1 RagB/SusD family nutrient uptake outer membrane protein [Polaribacter sp. 1_MG-2023]
MKFKSKIVIVFTLTLGMFGCSDFLEDQIQYNTEEMITETIGKSRGIIDDLYSDYSFNYFNDFSIEYLTDNAVKNSSQTNLVTGNWNSVDNPYGYVWQQSYHNMRQIFQYIELVHNEGQIFNPDPAQADLNERTIARYYGEAHFLKAWAEWELLKVFGGPSGSGTMLGFPIVNSTLENEEYAELTRNTYDECVAQIIADLEVAIENLPLVYTGTAANNPAFDVTQTGRASGLAAYALKAKVALYAASPAFNPTNDATKWETAAQYAHDLIEQNGGLKSLQAFNFSRQNNPDHIWRMRNGFNNNSLEKGLYPPSLYGSGQVNPSQNLIDAFPDARGYPIDNTSSTYDANTPYASRDDRFYKFVFYNQDQCFTSESCSEFSPLEIYEGGQDYYGGFNQSGGTRTGYYLKKFLSNLDFDPATVSATTTLPKVYVQLGLTDIYLIYAEALNEAYGDPNLIPAGLNYSAKEVLARVRQRGGIIVDPFLDAAASTQSDFRALVKNERRIELCFTGDRFHDLRRWKDIVNTEDIEGVKVVKNADDTFTYQNIDVESRIYGEKNYYLPLPYNELLINTNLEQNTGW